ncbi:hypothetical protein Sango_1979500 [Sesamum angolense]|uniref:Uncharacterized protein n=1 Tax=Sesamum angolense TaxID=2727404 RepID=A0AAE1WET3_9LAMI|nr:hypothetical protein Sango_1979500 [Sesamum angolense]
MWSELPPPPLLIPVLRSATLLLPTSTFFNSETPKHQLGFLENSCLRRPISMNEAILDVGLSNDLIPFLLGYVNMEGNGKISDYRRKLDKTLSSPDLTNHEILRTLVKNQILQSSECRLEDARTMLSKEEARRSLIFSAKQDTEELRVMYREGPEGSPFHTLLAEGYVDGPVDVCMCISWESSLYQKWWPQILIPTFKVVSSRCLQRVRTGEQISLVRMKVTWPLSSREALIHYFAFEYFQDDLVVVLLNSISDTETIDTSTHGFTRDGIPDAEEVVRIDVVGGFALQKVTANRSYFRTIASMDIKLDFVPPAIINFISRQLIGSGFKLYKKEVASVSKGDEKFCEALKEPLYARIREALYSGNTSLNLENLERGTSIMVEESREALGDDDAKENSRCDDPIVGSEAEEVMNEEESVISTKGEEALTTTNAIGENYVGPKTRKKVHVRPEVEQALKTLDKVISMFRENKCGPETGRPGINKINLTNLEKEAVEESTSSGADQMSGKKGNSAESSKINLQDLDTLERRTASSDSHASRHKGSNSYTRDQSKIAPASPGEDRSNPSNSNHRALHASVNQPTDSTVFEKVPENYTLMSADANTNAGTRVPKTKNKKSRLHNCKQVELSFSTFCTQTKKMHFCFEV